MVSLLNEPHCFLESRTQRICSDFSAEMLDNFGPRVGPDESGSDGFFCPLRFVEEVWILGVEGFQEYDFVDGAPSVRGDGQ